MSTIDDKKDAVGYILTPPRKLGVLDDPDVEQALLQQELRIHNFLEEHPTISLLNILVEEGERKRNRTEWPALVEAIHLVKNKKALLIIGSLKNLTNNDAFTRALIENEIDFYCCDQPLVNQENLKVLAEYQKKLRSIHGDLIKQGLERTSAKSGNPNAKEVISKVNRPKIEKAVIFAMLLHPVVTYFKENNYSQRKMVKELNDMGFYAPEGGTWVLSQLQKVLDRVRLNELAMTYEEFLARLRLEGKSLEDIAHELNQLNVPSIKKNAWDERQAKKLVDRVKEIHDILHFCEFTSEQLPMLTQFKQQGLSDTQIISRLVEDKFEVPTYVLEEIAEA